MSKRLRTFVDISESAQRSPHWSSRLPVYLAAAFGLALAIALGVRPAGIWSRAHGNERRNSIAVLPLDMQSEDADADYISDGIAGSINNSLSELSVFRVVPNSVTAQYKGKAADFQQMEGHCAGLREQDEAFEWLPRGGDAALTCWLDTRIRIRDSTACVRTRVSTSSEITPVYSKERQGNPESALVGKQLRSTDLPAHILLGDSICLQPGLCGSVTGCRPSRWCQLWPIDGVAVQAVWLEPVSG